MNKMHITTISLLLGVKISCNLGVCGEYCHKNIKKCVKMKKYKSINCSIPVVQSID